MLRKWRFDLIPSPYVHNSYEDYSLDWSVMLSLEFGKNEQEENIKEITASESRDFILVEVQANILTYINRIQKNIFIE